MPFKKWNLIKIELTQLHTNYKKKVTILFSFGISLQTWKKKKIFSREVQYYKKLENNNFDIKFITFGNKSDFAFSEVLSKIKIFPLFRYFNQNIFSKFGVIIIAPFILKNFVKGSDIIKTHQITSGLIAILIKIFNKKKIVCRAGWEPTLNYKLWNISYIKYLFYFINSYISYKYADKIIATTDDIKNFIIKRYNINPEKISIIPNAVDTQKFIKIENNNIRPRFICIARFEKQKNLFELIDVANATSIDLDILGEGPLKDNLISYIKKTKSKVKLIDTVDHENIPQVFSNYSSFITCSKIEGSPKVILEAMSCELSVFALSNSGISNLIKNNYNGYLLPDKEHLIDAIKLNSKNLEKLKQIGKNAREYIKNNFSLETCVRAESKIYNEL